LNAVFTVLERVAKNFVTLNKLVDSGLEDINTERSMNFNTRSLVKLQYNI